ncbi:MAG: hypothetical protein AB8H86_33330 [Polyangiales bacterium]
MPTLPLGPLVTRFLDERGATRTGPRGDAKSTTATLAAYERASWESVLEFEEDYGGLELCDPGSTTPALVVGPFACLSPGDYRLSEPRLIPVMFSADDVVYSLDEEGRGWTMAAMVEGKHRLSARNGRQLLTQAILWRALASDLSGAQLEQGMCGAKWAAKAELKPIHEASSDSERWWGDGERLVVELLSGNGYEGPTTVGRLG